MHVRRVFRNIATGRTQRPASGPMGEYMSASITKAQLETFLNRIGLDAKEEIDEVWEGLDLEKDGLVHFSEWMAFMNPFNHWARNLFMEGTSQETALTESEEQDFLAMLKRVEEVGDYAASKKVRLMIDAEQTYFQPAIDLLCKSLQRKHNKTFPSVYGTYQAYLRDSYSRMESDMAEAKTDGWIFAAKIVRGAYMVQENALAEAAGQSSPVWFTYEDTNRNYHRIVDLLTDNLDNAACMFATHNEDSVKYVVDLIDKKNLDRSKIAFGQLLGMCDHVSITLGLHGYKVFKYVPYGPIKDVVPYLCRRAEENSTLLGSSGVQKERKMIMTEIKNRLLGRKD